MTYRSISVCLASYNGEKYLPPQIDSILSQLKEGDELLVSDDGSNDLSLNILKSYGDKIRIVASDRVGGVVPNFERVISAALGDIITLSDQDDIWLEGRIESIRHEMNNCDLLISNGEVVNSDLKSKNLDVFDFVGFRPGFIKNFLKNSYVGCCMSFRRDLLPIILPFPPRIAWHDWYIALVAELFFNCKKDERKMFLFRRHSSNSSLTGYKSKNSIFKRIIIRLWIINALAISLFRYLTISLNKGKA